jgi:hypothetical protein
LPLAASSHTSNNSRHTNTANINTGNEYPQSTKYVTCPLINAFCRLRSAIKKQAYQNNMANSLDVDVVKMNTQESARNNAKDPSHVKNGTNATAIATNSWIDRSKESRDHLIGKTETNHDVALDESIRINHGKMMPPPLPPIIAHN